MVRSGDCQCSRSGSIMRTMKIKRLNLSQIKNIYRKFLVFDFPLLEQRPFSRIARYHRQHCYAGYGGYDEDGKLLCYAFFYVHSFPVKGQDGKTRQKRVCLLDYLAVTKDRRDGGIGTKFLQALIRHLAKREDLVFVEVEDPDRAENAEERATRERRMDFYARNGLVDTGVTAVVWTVPYRIIEMDLGEAGRPSWAPHVTEEVCDAVERVYHEFFPQPLYDRFIEVN